MIRKDIIAPPEKTRLSLWKFGVLGLFVFYSFGSRLEYNNSWRFFDGIDLWVHEAGHFFFMFLGNDFITIAGGTIMQLLVPLIFIFYFYYTGQKFSASLVYFWLGESILDVAIYMDDAIDRALPLIGGGIEGHDWHNMLSMLGMLHMAPVLSDLVQILGIGVIIIGVAEGLRSSRTAVTDGGSSDIY